MMDREDQSERIRRQLKSMAAGGDIRGMEIAHGIRVLSRLFDLAVNRSPEFGELSGPRLGILLRLYMEMEHGNPDGIKSGALGRFQDVKKNTISALLKGLEGDGLIERSQHPTDRRASLVRITPAGRKLVRSTAPLRFGFMNEVVSSLSIAEQDDLIRLLVKLHGSLSAHVEKPLCGESD
jgi:DNA-binding MarR family transcriptional regulator